MTRGVTYGLTASLFFASSLLGGAAPAQDAPAAGPPAAGPQDDLEMLINPGDELLEFDWPILSIGTAEYPDGPTGVTVFSFDRRVQVAIDSRGGGPGTVNAHYMDLLYDMPTLDALVFSGGSWYGLETATAVAGAMKDDGLRSGLDVAMPAGSIVWDYGSRRLNEIYPDKRLAQAAYRNARPGVFPQGAHGAGRMVIQGSYFGCKAHSGQGAAYREIGDLKIAAFIVVNAFGSIVDRDGSLPACHRGENWPDDVVISDLMTNFPASAEDDWAGPPGEPHNTTISLIVVNQTLEPALLQRLAAQVHHSISRAIQPYATIVDGDVLYAVSTGELPVPENATEFDSAHLGTFASEVMWDAILNSVPPQPEHPVANPDLEIARDTLRGYAGQYVFGGRVTVEVTERRGKLYAQSLSPVPAFAIPTEEPVELIPVSETEFTAPSRYPFLARFEEDGNLTFNPGDWSQLGLKQ